MSFEEIAHLMNADGEQYLPATAQHYHSFMYQYNMEYNNVHQYNNLECNNSNPPPPVFDYAMVSHP